MIQLINTRFNNPEEARKWSLSRGMTIKDGSLITVPHEDGRLHNELAQRADPNPGARLFMQQVSLKDIQVAGNLSVGFQYLGGQSNAMSWLDARIYIWNASQFQFAFCKMINKEPVHVLGMDRVIDYRFENNMYIGTSLYFPPGDNEVHAALFISTSPDSFMNSSHRPHPVSTITLYNHPEFWAFSSENYFRLRTHNYVNVLQWSGMAV